MCAKLLVTQVGPSVSVQDQGRAGHLRFGVTVSGAMDRTSLAIANAVLENPPSNPVVEISLGGMTLNCLEGSVSIAIVGGSFSASINNNPLPPWCMLTIHAGDTLAIRPGDWGSWCYLAFAGKLDANRWLDSYSVHLKSGVCGTALQQNESRNWTPRALLRSRHACPAIFELFHYFGRLRSHGNAFIGLQVTGCCRS